MKRKYLRFSSAVLIFSFLAFAISFSAIFAANNLLLNSGFTQAGDLESNASNWQFFGTGYSRVCTNNAGCGTNTDGFAIRLTSNSFDEPSGAYQRIDLKQEVLRPVLITGYLKGSDIINSPGGFFGASIYAEIVMNDGSIAYWNSIANSGTFPWRFVGFNTGTLASVDKPIDHIFIIPIINQARGTAYFDDISAREITPVQPAVTLMFDDGKENTFTSAKPVLDEYGFVGSVAIVTNLVGEEGYMGLKELKNLQGHKWEIVSHGLSHDDLTAMTSSQAQQEITGSKRALLRWGFQVRNFAMPFGAYNGEILGLSQKAYASARAFEQGDNPQGVFPYDVKVRGVINTTTADEVKSWLESAKANNHWVVLVFHDIEETGDDAYFTKLEVFQEMMRVVSESGIKTVTYDQGLKMFGAK